MLCQKVHYALISNGTTVHWTGQIWQTVSYLMLKLSSWLIQVFLDVSWESHRVWKIQSSRSLMWGVLVCFILKCMVQCSKCLGQAAFSVGTKRNSILPWNIYTLVILYVTATWTRNTFRLFDCVFMLSSLIFSCSFICCILFCSCTCQVALQWWLKFFFSYHSSRSRRAVALW